MKIILIVFGFILLTSTTFCLEARFTTPKPTCANNNQFIREIQKHLRLYHKPFLFEGMCRNEFPTFGTCCDQTKLIEFAEKDNASVMGSVKQVNYEYTRFEGALSKIFNTLKKVAFAPLISRVKSQKKVKNDKKKDKKDKRINEAIHAAQSLLKDKFILNYFHSYLDKEVPSPAEFNRTNTECWSKIMHARNSSICYACSGRSRIYFTGQGKAILCTETCKDFISVCRVPLETMGYFTKALVDLAEVVKRVKSAGIKLALDQNLIAQNLQRVGEVFKAARIPNLLKAYDTPGSNSMDFGVVLCGKFVRLREETLIEKMYDLFRRREGTWDVFQSKAIKSHIVNNMRLIEPKMRSFDVSFRETKLKAPPLWDSFRRLQEASPQPESVGLLGTDAVIYKQTDGQYRSYTGAPGTEPMCNTCAPTPMDMSNQFP